ncbi:MAG: hypothetical protein CMG66_03875 [Candidatus Marinimicrobia bacterium]|nr:hypothetical protein [Candidatus Neomarinimicrobiota bacterium]|tara:strand:- start:38108 stop:39823 length:1716 start_codon:yes stop_codon:yes gene_type:complete
MIIFRIILTLFFLSFGFNQEQQNKKIKNKPIFSNSESTQDYLDLLEKSLDLLRVNYVDSINESEVILSGIKGMLKPLDPYTKLLMDQSKESFDLLKTGKYGGIGVQIGLRRDTLTVLSIYENSPAYSEGLNVGDNIMMVDSVSTKGLSLKESSALIKGEIDSIVTLDVYRSSTKENIKFEFKRSNIKIEHVPYWGVNTDGIGYIRITRFSKNSAKDFKNGLKELNEKGLKSLIIDLRSNSGGLLSSAINILDNLTARGDTLLIQKGKTNRANKVWTSRRSPILSMDTPIVVLINRKSASASEIVAGTIQDLDRGVVIGQKSFGKGLVQHLYDLNDTTTLKVTTAKFYLPSGRLIQKQDYLDNGFLTDGLDKRDSVFVTKNGRVVKGGGGITPDLNTIPNQYSGFVNALWKDKVFLTFASDYAPKNLWLKDKLEKNLSIPNRVVRSFKEFVTEYSLIFNVYGEVDFGKIKEKIERNSISINKGSNNVSFSSSNSVLMEIDNYFNKIKQLQFGLHDNQKQIKNGLLREFCRIFFNDKKRIEVSLINDVEYNKAISILSGKLKEYNDIIDVNKK